MKILVTGDREWDNPLTILDAFIRFLEDYSLEPSDVTVIHGDARGADKLSAHVAEEMGMKPIPYPAEWNKFGRAAGPIRNKQMLDENPDIDLAFAFHPNLGKSKGTKDMVERLEKAGIEVRKIKA